MVEASFTAAEGEVEEPLSFALLEERKRNAIAVDPGDLCRAIVLSPMNVEQLLRETLPLHSRCSKDS